MTVIEISKELDFFEGEAVFVNYLDSFIWCNIKKDVMPYHSTPNKENDLQVFKTELFDLNQNFKEYFEKNNITKDDFVVICNNPEFLPKEGNYTKIKIIKNGNKRVSKEFNKNSKPNKGSK